MSGFKIPPFLPAALLIPNSAQPTILAATNSMGNSVTTTPAAAACVQSPSPRSLQPTTVEIADHHLARNQASLETGYNSILAWRKPGVSGDGPRMSTVRWT